MVQVKRLPELRVAYMHVIGSYDRSGETLMHLLQWVAQQGSHPAGPPLGIFYDNPAETPAERCRADICLPVGPTVSGAGAVCVRTVPAADVASLIQLGPYGKYDETYLRLYAWINENGYRPAGPPMEIYLCDPRLHRPEDLKTEVCVPVARVA